MISSVKGITGLKLYCLSPMSRRQFFLTCETEFVLILAVLENSVLPMADIAHAKHYKCNVCETLICKLVYMFSVFGEHGRYIGNINHLLPPGVHVRTIVLIQ